MTGGVVALALGAIAWPAIAAMGQVPPIDASRIEISVAERRLWVVTDAGDTLRSAPVAVGSGKVLLTAERKWTFRTPPGETRVIRKDVAPPWIPPDWHFVELARARGLELARLQADQPVELGGDRRLVVRGRAIGIEGPDSVFLSLPRRDEIVIDGTLYIPPFGTDHRQREGVLGPFRLQLANGIGLHGTLDKASIGQAASHGCVRLHDADITWLHEHIPVGTRVVIR